MSTLSRGLRKRRGSLILLAIGVALVVGYSLLSAFEIGKFGQPTDIGGGLILLVGLVLALIAAIILLVAGLNALRLRSRK